MSPRNAGTDEAVAECIYCGGAHSAEYECRRPYPQTPVPPASDDLLRAEVARLTGERDEARAFIDDLVQMQSGSGWTRAVVREAATAFLAAREIKPTANGDTSPAFILRAAAEARALSAEAERDALKDKLAKAVEALEPFADRVPAAAYDMPPETIVCRAGMEIKHFRRAREARARAEEETR